MELELRPPHCPPHQLHQLVLNFIFIIRVLSVHRGGQTYGERNVEFEYFLQVNYPKANHNGKPQA